MSIIVVAWVRDNFKGPKVEKIVLLTLASRVGEKDYCFTFMEKLAKDVEYSVRHVRRAIASLREKGVLEVVDRRHKHLSNKFFIRPEMFQPDADGRSNRTPATGGPDRGDRSILNKLEETIKRTPAVRTAEMTDMKTEDVLLLLKKEKETLSDRDMVDKLNGMGQTLGNATRIWRAMHARWHESYLPEFTGKEMGQFKTLLQRAPSGRALAIMGIAIRHWEMIPRPKGMHRPHIGFLLTKIGEADQLMHEVLEPKGGKNNGPQELVRGEW